MKNVKITPDLIISLGMAIALILAIIMKTPAEVTIGIAGGLAGYLGQVVTDDKPRKSDKQEAV